MEIETVFFAITSWKAKLEMQIVQKCMKKSLNNAAGAGCASWEEMLAWT